MKSIWNALRLTVTPFFILGLLLYFGIVGFAYMELLEWNKALRAVSLEESSPNLVNQAAAQNKGIVVQSIEYYLKEEKFNYIHTYSGTSFGRDFFEGLAIITRVLDSIVTCQQKYLGIIIPALLFLSQRLCRWKFAHGDSVWITGLRTGICMALFGLLMGAR